MGLKESGLRGSLRNVSVGIDAIPDSVDNHWPIGETDTETLSDNVGNIDLNVIGGSLVSDSNSAEDHHYDLDGVDDRIIAESSDSDHFTQVNEMTLLWWVKADGANIDELDTVVNTSPDGGLAADNTYFWFDSGGQLEVRVNVDDNTSNDVAITIDRSTVFDDNWHLIGQRYRETNGDVENSLWFDDANHTTKSMGGSVSMSGTEFSIGGAFDGSRRMADIEIDFGAFAQNFMADDDILNYYSLHPRSD